MLSREDAQTLVEDCEAREGRMTDWEREFVDSVSKALADGGPFTVKMSDKLEEVWERVTAKG